MTDASVFPAPSPCNQCPRRCNVRRNEALGFCGVSSAFRVARCALHPWEEPPISGTNGSGTIFFSGCNLRCVFCQNREISHERLGKEMSPDELLDQMLRLQAAGAHNINLVTPSHYTKELIPVLRRAKPLLHIPIVWNSSCYELPETLHRLEGLVDIYLPDVKYFSSALSADYSAAPDYFPVAVSALREMLRQVGAPQYDPHTGLLQKGVIVRHLVLPGQRRDSAAVLQALAETFGTDHFLLSLMRQYTPDFAMGCPFENLHRRLTTFEYRFVADRASALGFDGFLQDASSATASFTPDFHESSQPS